MIPLGQKLSRGASWRIRTAVDRATRVQWPARSLLDFRLPADLRPGVTLVVVGRNDNYGGDFQARLRESLAWNLQPPVVEAIYVEWNPLPDRPSDAGWLVERFPQLRVYVVGTERHARCCTHPRMPLMEYFAKNVGIRRANQPWICLVNADVLIHPEVFRRMERLRPDCVYGTHSVNIRWGGEPISSRHFRDRSLYLGGYAAEYGLYSVSGNLTLARRDRWHQARGYDESLTDRRISCDGHGLAQLYHHGARPRVIGHHYHLDHPESSRNVRLPHQGEVFHPWSGVPYRNPDGWGQADARERALGERIFLLE